MRYIRVQSWGTCFWVQALHTLLRASLGLTLILIGVVFGCQNAYADESTISMEIGTLENLALTPNTFNSVSQTIAVETSSQDGYNITFETVGDATDLRLAGSDQTGIPTITLPSGSETIRPADFGFGYGYSLDNTNFKPVPNANGGIDVIGSTTSANIGAPDSYTLTYGAKISSELPAGTYTRTFIITASANSAYACPAGYICYDDNGSDDETMMPNQSAASNADVVLSAPNYRREGYGFAGWNTEANGTGTTYGPNQTIRTGDLSRGGLVLHARWIASSGTLQGWSGCSTMATGGMVALTDTRDGNTYAVAKEVDGECWMMENLRLDFSDADVSINASNTNNPTASFVTATSAHPAQTSTFCNEDTNACVNQIQYNTANITGAEDWSVYAYGNYYNWYTSTAGNGLRSTSETEAAVAGDICPAGWHLPTGFGIHGDLAQMDIALGGTGTNQTDPNTSRAWRSFPVNLVYSGEYNVSSADILGASGHYHASTSSSWVRSNNLWLMPTSVSTNTNGVFKNRGNAVRCLANNSFTVEFDANTNKTVSGTMVPQPVTYGRSENLKANVFSIANSETKGYRFVKWNTAADGSGTDYADEAAVQNLAAVGGRVTLYAQWEEYSLVSVTVVFADSGTSGVEFSNDDYGTRSTDTSNMVLKLASGVTYNLAMELNADYEFASFAATSGTLGSATTNPTTYATNSAATLTVTTESRTGKLYLQNVTLATCTTTATVAYDSRDENEYTIKRLSDGKCWMMDNLKLGSDTDTIELTTADTNLAPGSSSFTLPASSTTNSYTAPQINTSKVDDTATAYGENSGKIGVYYNYCAASAGEVCTDSAMTSTSYDICPKGWTLPDGDKYTGDAVTIYNTYGSYSASITAFSAILSGYFNFGTRATVNLGTNGYFWTATAYNNNKAFMIEATKNWWNYASGGVRNNGLTIRCKLK